MIYYYFVFEKFYQALLYFSLKLIENLQNHQIFLEFYHKTWFH